MVNEYSNNPWDHSMEIFLKTRAQVSYISRDMSFLRKTLKRKFGYFKEFGSSNLEDDSDEKYGDK